MTVEQVKKIMECGEFEYYGIRSDETVEYKIGDTCFESHQWLQDDPEDGSEYNKDMGCWDGGELSGTCALKITDASDIAAILAYSKETYGGSHICLIGGYSAEYGVDPDEIIIHNAEVLCV